MHSPIRAWLIKITSPLNCHGSMVFSVKLKLVFNIGMLNCISVHAIHVASRFSY